QYNMPVEVLAQANDLSPSTSLRVGQNITIPSRSQVQRLEREAAAAEKSAEAKRNAQQKLTEARKEVKETDAKGSFGVQVALANNQAKADELAKKLQAAGYQVKTSPTSRGVRVIVGPERGKVAALALKDKINSDPKLNASEAWVLYWR
ncbi:MAG: SPOR domain-containing protein, partial [Psychrobacter sp.]|nr:SPOR domain-containing protein [Psychrobacter sp.]